MTDPLVIPELTRGLRAFASPRSLGGAHDRVFGPFLEARRSAARATRWQDRLAAFDADRLEATLRVTLQSMAAESHPDSQPDQRALAARLVDRFAATFSALGAVGVAASAVVSAVDDDGRRERWGGFTIALRSVFRAVDEDWGASQELLRVGSAREASTS